MRRITMWITSTIAVVALMFSYQLNASGATGKAEGGAANPSTSTGKPGERK